MRNSSRRRCLCRKASRSSARIDMSMRPNRQKGGRNIYQSALEIRHIFVFGRLSLAVIQKQTEIHKLSTVFAIAMELAKRYIQKKI